MVKDYSLEDPVLRVKSRFLSAVGQTLGIQKLQSIQDPLSADDLDELKTKFRAGLLFDFRTMNWAAGGYPFRDDSHYQILYSGRARLLSLSEPKVLWQGICDVKGKDPTISPTLDELIANNGALIKEKLNESADTCADQLMAQFEGKENPDK